MKRISVSMIVLFLTTASVVNGHYYYSSSYNSVHYSPYAFDYNHSGLVYGGIKYSPYAFSYNSSGLIYGDVSYTPYAFSYGHSGLIDGYFGYYPYPRYSTYTAYYPVCAGGTAPVRSGTSRMPSNYCITNGGNFEIQVVILPQEKAQQRQESGKALQEPRKQDGGEIIRAYLLSKNINDFRTDHTLRINSRTLSVDFVLREKNLIIKYWNADAIQALESEPEYKKKYYENYKKDWDQVWVKYLLNGDKVYQVNGSDKDEIIKTLEQCAVLNAG